MNFFRLLARSPVTSAFFMLCIAVAFWTLLGRDDSRTLPLMISQYNDGSLSEITRGQLWRLFTPMLLHFTILHILFNMMWLLDLGVAIEQRHGSLRLLVLIVVIALFSNLGQFYWTYNPQFGGMSGVVYGLLGYIWVYGRLNPDKRALQLPTQIVYFMLIWFVLCWTGVLGPIANMAHTTGLLMGMLLAWLFSPNKDLRQWRKPDDPSENQEQEQKEI